MEGGGYVGNWAAIVVAAVGVVEFGGSCCGGDDQAIVDP